MSVNYLFCTVLYVLEVFDTLSIFRYTCCNNISPAVPSIISDLCRKFLYPNINEDTQKNEMKELE